MIFFSSFYDKDQLKASADVMEIKKGIWINYIWWKWSDENESMWKLETRFEFIWWEALAITPAESALQTLLMSGEYGVESLENHIFPAAGWGK